MIDKLPEYLKQTPIDRVMTGFNAEIDTNPDRFFNFHYIQGIINQETIVAKLNVTTLLGLLILNCLSLFYVQGVALDFELFGQKIQEIPASAEILCFLLGSNIFVFAINSLDVMLFSRLRFSVIHKLLFTDLTNMATAHLKGNGVWIDLLTPRFIGYSSGKLHKFFLNLFNQIAMFFYLLLFIASSASLIGLFRFASNTHESFFEWSSIISFSGLLIGLSGILFFYTALFIPFKFDGPKNSPTPENSKKALFPDNDIKV